MAVNVTDAHEYIMQNAVDVESWSGLSEDDRTRFLNVASRILSHKFSAYTIPDTAVYLYANELATAYNDVNKYAAGGVQSFGVTGAASFSFFAKTAELGKTIPIIVLDEISAANGNKLLYRRVGMAVY